MDWLINGANIKLELPKDAKHSGGIQLVARHSALAKNNSARKMAH
jgi:hypothetical protein